MFTGIVTDIGKVRHVEKRGDTHLVFATRYDVSSVEIGASIACSGVCLTVVDKGNAKDLQATYDAQDQVEQDGG